MLLQYSNSPTEFPQGAILSVPYAASFYKKVPFHNHQFVDTLAVREIESEKLCLDRCGNAMRKLGHFLRLAALGSHEFLKTLPNENFLTQNSFAFVLTSPRGSFLELEKNSSAVFKPQSAYFKPISFINSVGNVAVFHLLRSLGFSENQTCESYSITSGLDSFKSAFDLASTILAQPALDFVVVCCAETIGTNLEQELNIYPMHNTTKSNKEPLPASGEFIEGSAWYLFARCDRKTTEQTMVNHEFRILNNGTIGDAIDIANFFAFEKNHGKKTGGWKHCDTYWRATVF